MIIKTEAAAVTIKRNGASYNNDSININGKVPSLDSANAGYKGAGSMSAPFAVALSSSERNGFAAAALTAFNDRLPMLKQCGEDFAQILSDYFCDSEYALEKSQCSSSVLATSVLYGYGCNIVAARMGSSRLYRYADGTLTSIGLVMKPGEDHVPFSSCELIENVGDGELYVLCSGGVFSVLTDEEISSVLASCEGSAKRAAQALTTAALSREGSEDAVSIIVLKVDADGEPAVAPILPVTPEEAAAAALSEEATAAALTEEQEANPSEEETQVIPEEELPEQPQPEEEAPVSKTNKTVKRLLTVILIICGMVVLTFATYKIAGAIKNRAAGKTGETTTAETTLEESTTEEPTTEAQSTTEQNTTEPAATNAPTTAVPVITPPATTKRRPVTNPPTQAPTTRKEEPVSTTEPTGETESTTETEEPSGEAESTTVTLETNSSTTAVKTENPTALTTANTQAASTSTTAEVLG